jgi:glucan endo-1,3-alpha-glucosidase
VNSSGGNGPVSVNLPVGINTINAPMGVGTQTFELSRNGATVFKGNGGLAITNANCAVYNFNAYVGSVSN